MIFKHCPGGAIDMPPLHWTRVLDVGSEIRNGLTAHEGRKMPCRSISTSAPIASEKKQQDQDLPIDRQKWRVCRSIGSGLSTPPHFITQAGVVSPSIQCPVIENGQVCDGHEDAGSVLEGWAEC